MTLASVLALTSCAGKAPKPPYIQLHMHDISKEIALCTDSNGDECPPTDMSKTDKWFMLHPKYFQAIQDYIDLLVCKLNGGCASVLAQDFETMSVMNEQEQLETLAQAKKRMNRIKNNLKGQLGR